MNKAEFPQTLSCTYPSGTALTMGRSDFSAYNPWKTVTEFPTADQLDKLINMKPQKETKKSMSKRRLVKVMIVDSDENVPVEKAVLINEAEKITDLDDQELFFELDVKRLVEDHNDYRATVIDKKQTTTEKTVYLEPVRIRDLKMVVLNIADF